MLPEFSIIICAYNAHLPYLAECLRFITQSSIENYEIVFIDDGSATDYSEVLAEYAKVVRYIPLRHGGTLLARLAGIDAARGKYIAFADSDDLVSFSYYRNLLSVARSGFDIALGDWAFKTEKSQFYCAKDSTIAENIEIHGDISDFIFEKSGKEHARYVLWNKIFRASVLKEAAEDIRAVLPDFSLCYGEDVLINFFAQRRAKSLKNVHGNYYFYRLHDAQMVKLPGKEKLDYVIDCMNYVFNVIVRAGLTARQNSLLAEWKSMLCRDFYSNAREIKAFDLYIKLQQDFGIQKLQKYKFKDHLLSFSHKLLPDNFFEYEELLRTLQTAGDSLFLGGFQKSLYFNRELEALCAYTHKTYTYIGARGDYSVPRPINSLRNRVIHCSALKMLAGLLFPKGSKAHRALKKLL